MQLAPEQVKLVKKIVKRRQSNNLINILAFISGIPLLFFFWFSLGSESAGSTMLTWMAIFGVLWARMFLFPMPGRNELEDLLLAYINNDADSIALLAGNDVNGLPEAESK